MFFVFKYYKFYIWHNSSFNLILKQVFIEKNWNRSNVVTAGIIIYFNFFCQDIHNNNKHNNK